MLFIIMLFIIVTFISYNERFMNF